MTSYFKNNWFHFLAGITCFVIAFIVAPTIIIDECSTIVDLADLVHDAFAALGWCTSGAVWLLMSFINHSDDRIELLEAKAAKYDALCELVHELVKATEIDREVEKAQDERIKYLEERLG